MNYPKRIIERGEADKDIVKAIQAQLNFKGCGPIEVDGDFGYITLRAVKLFQSRHSDNKGNPLVTDGRIGPVTWDILFSIAIPVSVPQTNLIKKKLLK